MKKILTIIVISFFIMLSNSCYSIKQANGQALPSNLTKTPISDLTQNVDFGPYMRKMQRKIKSRWYPPKDKIGKRVTVLFRINKDGTLKKINIYKSSGDMEADAAAINAVEACVPFDTLPAEYKGDSVPVKFTFDYNMFRGYRNEFSFSIIQSVLTPNIDSSIEFSTYMNNLKRKVKNYWNYPKNDGSRSLTLTFILDKNGNISNVEVIKSSGDTSIDKTAVCAVIASSPFGPLPSKYNSLPVTLVLTCINRKTP